MSVSRTCTAELVCSWRLDSTADRNIAVHGTRAPRREKLMPYLECPKCHKKFYQRPKPRRRYIDPTALTELPPLPEEEGDWRTTEQVAAELNIKPNSLLSMVSRQKFPKPDLKWRRRNYWKSSTVKRWWEESRQFVVRPPGGQPKVEPSQTPPRGKGGRFVKISKVEIIFEP